MSVRVFAPAKINLTLQVARPRADGMHELQSAVVFADVGDWIEAEIADVSRLHVTGPFRQALASDEDNIVLKAIAAIDRQHSGTVLTLEKNLPVASGIGGGSSDAAATLKAFDRLWKENLSDDFMMRVAAELGADVPVCLRARSAWMTGIGEKLHGMANPALDAVLINPGKPLSTAAVFREFDRLGLGGFDPLAAPHWASVDEAVSDMRVMGNDLETPAINLMPEIGDILVMLRADPRVAYAALSGSGATMFAITHTGEQAQALAKNLAERDPNWWVRATTLAGA